MVIKVASCAISLHYLIIFFANHTRIKDLTINNIYVYNYIFLKANFINKLYLLLTLINRKK